MKPLGLSKQIIIIAILPALLVGILLSVYFTYDQISFISKSQSKYGKFIIDHIQPLATQALIKKDIASLKPVIENIITYDNVSFVRLSDKKHHDIIIMHGENESSYLKPGFIHNLLENRKYVSFKRPIKQSYVLPDGTTFEEKIATLEIRLDTREVTIEKIKHIIRRGSITLMLLLLFSLFILKFSRDIISPIKSLTSSVRKISAGDLDSQIKLRLTGELGVLESCINHMRTELKSSQADLEIQLNVYTEELQQTLEELEVRNAELDITRSKAIYANNAKSEFLANMSHEIRTPLSGIIGFTELLQGTNLSSQQKDYATTIQKSSRSLMEIINDILDLSKIESGKTEISTSEFNLIDIVEDIINLLTPSALAKDVELFYRFDKDIPNIIQADPFRIHQVLTNLIGNAIKFTDKGYVYLQITKGQLQNTEFSIKFSVSDTGIGMNKSDKKKLFKAFTQADTSITRRFGGTGLGLVISRKLTLLMKGEISFDSTESEGSTFWFSVPVTPVSHVVLPSDINNKKIAFINDHFIAKQAFRSLFTNANADITDLSLEDADSFSNIEKDFDAVVYFLSRKNIKQNDIHNNLNKLTFSIPSLLIASTRSHTKLRNLQQHVFDNAVFTSEKIERIKQKLINIINKRDADNKSEESDVIEDDVSDWSSIKVMVVDDNEVNLRLAEILLHKHKTRVTTALTGAQAIDYASLNSFDLIFMDLHMPGLDGYETTKKIRETTPGKQPVIIALTANALPQEKEKVIQSKMNGILIKPVSDALLQKVINQWVLKKSSDTSFSEISQEPNKKSEKVESMRISDNEIFSIELAKEFTGNNKELAYELFSMLRAELNDYIREINEAVGSNNLTKLREQVHKLHGASRCCGTSELKNCSSHIEKLIDSNIKFDIEKEIANLRKAIENVANFKLKENA